MPVAGRGGIDLPAKPGRKARQTLGAIRFAKVDVREIDPPPGEAVH